MDTIKFPLERFVILVLAACYLAGGLLLWIYVGPWEMVRRVVVNGLLVAAWLFAAHRILGNTPLIKAGRIKNPKVETSLLLLVLLAIFIYLILTYIGSGVPRWLFYVLIYGFVFGLYIVQRYPLSDLGLRKPSHRGWWALLVVILINFVAAALYQVLPAGEYVTPLQADLSTNLTGPGSVMLLIFSLLFRAALPEELLLRVSLQPRLAKLVPLGWAILLQAALFSLAHVPQKILYYQYPWYITLAYTLLIDNGLIAGYLWWRTRSLPLLLILHLFAFPRLGV